MKSIGLLKVATSGLILGAALTGISQAGGQVASFSDSQPKAAVKQAANLAKSVHKALAKGNAAEAVVAGETMVTLIPNDAGYRQLLGEAYLAAGRFYAAETTLSDALDLAPANEKVALKLALVKAALGKQEPAQTLLRGYRDRLSGTDFGLAMALSGDLETATSTLETVVRSTSADARARQNLALVYAMSNRWVEARTVAAQDLAPELLSERMTQWASFVRPRGSWDQVATLLNVKPAYDAGQPTALALAPRTPTQPAQQASAEPESSNDQAMIAAADPVPVYKPVESANADSAPVFAPVEAESADVPVVKSSSAPVKTALASAKHTAKPGVKAPAAILARSESGHFAVQLGAFDTASKANAAWAQAVAKVDGLKGRKASRTAVTVNKSNFVRLAVAGLDTRAQADSLCASVRSSGGTCFVRAATNDASRAVRYASKPGPKLASAAGVKPKVKLNNAQPTPKPVRVAANLAVKPVAKPGAKPAAKPVAAAPKPTKIASR